MPAALQASAPSASPPAKASTSLPCRFARRATPAGALPIAVWASRRPSPVTTTSAARIFSSSPVSCITISMPGTSDAPRKVRRAKPMPPAAPEPGKSASLSGNTAFVRAAKARSQPSILRIRSASAPFCGPNTALHPSGPHSGFSTSHATRNVQSRNSVSACAVPILCRYARPAAPRGIGAPLSSSRSKPSACSMPAPPSFVALPPRPTTNRRQPRATASRITSPTPNVVVFIGSRASGGTCGRPAAPAISTTARPPAMPYRQVTGAPSGPVTETEIISPLRPAVSASAVPSPPSASEQTSATAPGTARSRPAHTASPASSDDRLPLNESTAIKTLIMLSPPYGLRPCDAAPFRFTLAPLLPITSPQPAAVTEIVTHSRAPCNRTCREKGAARTIIAGQRLCLFY